MDPERQVIGVRQFDILQGWDGAQKVQLLFGGVLVLFGLLVALFPKLLVFIFAAVCITSGIASIQAAFNQRRYDRENRDRFDLYSIW